MPLTTFEPFNRLPLEVRRLIWWTSVEPRTVSIVWNPNLSECVTPEIPSILHVSREAREEGLRTYTQTLSDSTLSLTNSKIFFSYNMDTTLISIENYTKYGVSFLDGLKNAKTSMSKHHRLVRFVVIDWFNLDFAPGLAITHSASHFPLLEKFSISDCEEGGLKQKKTVEILNTSTGGQEVMPVLRCLRNGYHCDAHWWYEDWNKCQPRDVESWGKAFDWVRERASRRYYLGTRHADYAETDQIGLPLDIADVQI